jgi:ADP-heptose:LPS heptosyltransferase
MFPQKAQLMLGEGNYGFLFHPIPLRDPEPVRVWWADPTAGKIDVTRILKGAPPCDLFICLSTWSSASIVELAHRMGARRTIGFDECFDEPVSPPAECVHLFDYLFAIAQELDPSLSFERFNEAPTFSSAAEEAAARFVARHIKSGERLLFVHPESSSRTKMWDTEHWEWVLKRFVAERPEFKIFLSSLEPCVLDLGVHRDRLIYFAEPLELSLASMRYADGFLGIDSCFLHAADLFRLPAVGLFGPTKPDEWGFRITPCFRHEYGYGTMEKVRRDAVLESLLEIAACNPGPSRAQSAIAFDREGRVANSKTSFPRQGV